MKEEAMFVEWEMKQHGRLWRCVIVAAPLVEPPAMPAFEVLFVTPWMRSPESAAKQAMARYFPMYEFRQGFKHPQDPSRTEFDAPADACVVSSELRLEAAA